MIISESIPSTSRGKPGAGAFAFQAVGALGGTAVGYFVLVAVPEPQCLALDVRHRDHSRLARHALAASISSKAPTGCTRGRDTEKAEQAASQLLLRKPQYPATSCSCRSAIRRRPGESHNAGLFFPCSISRNRRATILASVPWFLQDLGTYGIGIFTPTILAAAMGANEPIMCAA